MGARRRRRRRIAGAGTPGGAGRWREPATPPRQVRHPVVAPTRQVRHPVVADVAGVEVEGLEAGAIDYITKPFFMPELKARLMAVLQHKIMYDKLKRIQDTLIRNERLRTMKDLTEAVQGSINEPLTLKLIFHGLRKPKIHHQKRDD